MCRACEIRKETEAIILESTRLSQKMAFALQKIASDSRENNLTDIDNLRLQVHEHQEQMIDNLIRVGHLERELFEFQMSQLRKGK